MTDPGFVAAGFVVTSTVVAVYAASLRTRLAQARRNHEPDDLEPPRRARG